MPVTKTVFFLKDDSLCETRCSLPIKSDLDRFLSINGATFNQVGIDTGGAKRPPFIVQGEQRCQQLPA